MGDIDEQTLRALILEEIMHFNPEWTKQLTKQYREKRQKLQEIQKQQKAKQRERFKLFLLRGDYPFRYSTYIALILCSLRPPSNFSPPFCRFCDSPCIQYFLFDIRERFAFGFGCGLWFAVSKKRHRYDYSYKLKKKK